MKLAGMLSALIASALAVGSVAADAKDPPGPPKPPKAPKVTVQIDGLEEVIDDSIQEALGEIGKDARIPAHVRGEIQKRLEGVRKKLKDRAAKGKLSAADLGELGEEIGREMEAFGKDMDAWSKQFDKQMNGKWGGKWGGKFDFHLGGKAGDDDDDDDDEGDDDDDDHDFALDFDDNDGDLGDAIRDMGALNLRPQQRDQIKKLRVDSEAKVANARRELDRASRLLEKQLQNPATSEAEIARSIDAVTQQESAIRKARILAWVNARRVLDDGQRKKVERAATGKSK
jgi:Spy/CpxP family protein refolding chaperone